MKKRLKELITANYGKENGVIIKGTIEDYVDKIYTRAKIITYSSEGSIQGFIAYYSNDPKKELAFLTMLLVDSKTRNSGIGSLLLKASISDIVSQGISAYRLEVLKTNQRAIEFYKNHGFSVEEDFCEKLKMIGEFKK